MVTLLGDEFCPKFEEKATVFCLSRKICDLEEWYKLRFWKAKKFHAPSIKQLLNERKSLLGTRC